MLRTLFSEDLPKGRVLTLVLLGLFLGLAFAPFLFPGAAAINTAAKICIFIVLVASYDILIGYTGIVSFAQTMFFGIGGYGVGLALYTLGASWPVALLGLVIALIVGVVLAFVIGLVSLRVKAIFFAMITLAVASAFLILATRLSEFTGGEDGRSFSIPAILKPSYTVFDTPVFGIPINGRILAYYLVFFAAVVLFLVALRLVNSCFGRVLQAIRENEMRAEALGYRVVYYRTLASCLSAALAVCAGALSAIWLRYTGPETTLSFAIMLDVLLMVVIGGMGTLYGAVIGASLFIIAQNYLQKLMAFASSATEGIPLLPRLLHPDRWLLLLGVLFVLSVYFFPTGIVGRLARKPQAGK
jgi:branched-chain amino acid transport system permease protein